MKNLSDKESRSIYGGTGIIGDLVNWVRTTVLGQEPQNDEPTVGDCFNQGEDE